MSGVVHHREGCDGTDDDLSPWRGQAGDYMVTCRLCGWYSRQDHTPEPKRVTVPMPKLSRFVCREHHKPVDHRGRGCSSCAARRRDVDEARAEAFEKAREKRLLS